MSKKPSKKSLKVSQEELRKLMKLKTQGKRIESPFAKYNSLDQLTCSACAKVIKSNQLWEAHVLSKPHKECFAGSSLACLTPLQMVEMLQKPGPLYNPLKGSAPNKKAKIDPPPPPKVASKPLKPILKNSYSKSQSSSTTTQPTTTENNNISNQKSSISSTNNIKINDNYADKAKNTEAKVRLKEPKDGENDDDDDDDEKEEEEDVTASKEDTKKANSSSTAIPEGFFDDPKRDAKARNIKYVDKLEEEMELFQKEIKQAEQENQVLVEEEDELTSEQKSLDQLDEEINLWSRPFTLAKTKEEELQKVVEKTKVKQEATSDEEDVDLTSLLDWRSKVPFKK